MANPSKDKGTKGETAVVKWLQANGYPDARRNTLGGKFDPGDVEPIPLAAPPIIISVKVGYGLDVHPQTKKWQQWWADLEKTMWRRNPDAFALLVHKREGKASPGFWHWYCDVSVAGFGPIKITGPQALELMRIHRPLGKDSSE